MASRALRFLISLGLALLISGAMTYALNWGWRAIGGGELTVHGWIALLIGTFGTVGLAWGLMALAFKSSREGWDDRVDNSLDPGRDETDDDLY